MKLDPKYMHGIEIDDLPYQINLRLLRKFVEQGCFGSIDLKDFARAYNNIGNFWRIERLYLFSKDGKDIMELVDNILYKESRKFAAMTREQTRKMGLENPW